MMSMYRPRRTKWIRLILLIGVWHAGLGADRAFAWQPTASTLYLAMLANALAPTLWETEPNDAEARADGPLFSAVGYFGRHDTGGALDSDYWIFYAAGPGPMHMVVDGLDPFGQVVVTRVNNGQIGYVGGPPYVVDAQLPGAGDYVIRVVSTAAMSTDVYTLTVTHP